MTKNPKNINSIIDVQVSELDPLQHKVASSFRLHPIIYENHGAFLNSKQLTFSTTNPRIPKLCFFKLKFKNVLELLN